MCFCVSVHSFVLVFQFIDCVFWFTPICYGFSRFIMAYNFEMQMVLMNKLSTTSTKEASHVIQEV